MKAGRQEVTFSDDFVARLVRNAAEMPVIVNLPENTSVEAIDDKNEKIDNCLKTLDKHNSISDDKPDTNPEADMLRLSLTIIVNILEMQESLTGINHLIKSDWKSHIEIDKSKRYRDHINHPLKVTGIGLWLLHRNSGKLLSSMAKSYELKISRYRKSAKTNIEKWWKSHPMKNEIGSCIINQIKSCSPEASSITLDPKLLPWLALVEYAWLACGLLHDAAYPLEHQLLAGTRLYNRFSKTFPSFGLAVGNFNSTANINDLVDQLKNSYFLEQIPDFKERFSEYFPETTLNQKSIFKHSHALFGGLHQLFGFNNKLDTVQGLMIQLAAIAIAVHHDDADKAASPIHTDELSKLLFISDQLQSWGRSFLHRGAVLKDGTRKFLPIIECREMILHPLSQVDCYLVKFQMTRSEKICKILKDEYDWQFNEFNKPYSIVEQIIEKDSLYPKITLTKKECILPKKFRDFMGVI